MADSHNIHVGKPVRGFIIPQCTCGWRGSKRKSIAGAVAEAGKHARDVRAGKVTRAESHRL
jgi:hypothetical protein